MDIQQRLAEFFRRLSAAPPAATADEAMTLVCQRIEAVEDEHCPVPRVEPPPLAFTGRMYAPQADRMTRQADGNLTASTRRHRIVCQSNGANTIVHMAGKAVVFSKPGSQP